MMTKAQAPYTSALAIAVALTSTLLAPSAFACGGFFCSQSAPIVQAAERIIFAQEGNQVTQIVEVAYDGPSEKFSWVLPVPGIPVPAIGSSTAFDRLDVATAPRYQLQMDFNCSPLAVRSAAMGGPVGSTPGDALVTVIDGGSVGPFDYQTISISVDDEDPAEVAIDWLTANGYDVTDETGEVLGPYLANGLNLIAFRLQKGEPTGAIRPISLEYEANAMAIPIRPTSVSATDDLPVLVWLLGEARAVPTNYYGLEINESLIDWFNPASTYNDVVSAAANEAGGQGFVTELTADAADYVGTILSGDQDVYTLTTNAESDIEAIAWLTGKLTGWDGFDVVAAKHLQLREDITVDQFIKCVGCYLYPQNYSPGILEREGFDPADADGPGLSDDDPIHSTDVEAYRAELMEMVVQPVIDMGELLEKHNKITRLFTTMSADEMTLDPVFQFNNDLGDVSNLHTAVQEYVDQTMCTDQAWVVTLEDGTKIEGNDTTWPHVVTDTSLPANTRIFQFSTSGEGVVIDDIEAELAMRAEDEKKSTEDTSPPDDDDDKEKENKDGDGDGDDKSEEEADDDSTVNSDSAKNDDSDKEKREDDDIDCCKSDDGASVDDEDGDVTKSNSGGCAIVNNTSQAPNRMAWIFSLGLLAAFTRRRTRG